MTYYENTTDKSTHVTEDTGKLTTGKYEMKDISKFTEFGGDVSYVESGKLVDASEVNISNKNIFKELQKTSVYSDGQYLYRFFGWSADHNTLTDTDTNSALYQSHFRVGHVLGGSPDWQTLKAANEPLTDTICYDNVISNDFNTYSTAVIRATKLVNNRVAPPVNTQYLEAKMFAIWDGYPTITQTSTPTICTTDDALASKDKLIEKLKSIVTAVDIEDGTVPVTISNIDYDEVMRIAQSLSSQQIERLSFLVTAVDKVGNTTYYNARVSIKNNATTPDDYMMTLNEYKQRFINEHYYSLGDKKGSNYANDYSVSNYHNYGGLNPKSKWYLDDSYRIEILDAFKNVEDGTPEEVWTFTGDVVTDAKKYIDVHGFHKWQEESGLINFYNSFKDRAKDKEAFTKGEY